VKTLIYCDTEAMLDGFRHGHSLNADRSAAYTQSVDTRGYWLLIECDGEGDNHTYELSESGLVHTDTGVEN